MRNQKGVISISNLGQTLKYDEEQPRLDIVPPDKKNKGGVMRPDEALQIIGDWISDETKKRKYAKITLIELSEALITLKNVIRRLSDEYL